MDQVYGTSEIDFFPLLPDVSENLIKQCYTDGDFRPIIFDIYRYIAKLSLCAARVSEKSKSVAIKDTILFSIVKGLLNRCARLMVANVRLSHEGRFGESTLILDRCIAETSNLVRWLIDNKLGDTLRRYLADGLKTELSLKKEIDSRILKRNGVSLPIEDRMIEGIEECLSLAGLIEEEVYSSKKMPPFSEILKSVEKSSLQYVVLMKIGSHAVHGSWPALLSHYLERASDGSFQPRDANTSTDYIQYCMDL
jgi:Family of unknown function (DUF5677)